MIRDAELFTVGCEDVVVTFVTDSDDSVATVVGDREINTTGPYHYAAIGDLDPSTEYSLRVEGATPSELLPRSFVTAARPSGRRVATFATVNDVHFGESECGRLGTPEELGPILSSEAGDDPYPEVMNRAVIADMAAAAPDAYLVKGDLTDDGSEQQYAMFLAAYETLGERMHHVRGNHDAMITHTIASDRAPFVIALDGVQLAVLDTVRPGTDKGRLTGEQREWLDELAVASTDPVLVFGHHHPWDPASHERKANYFGINPDDSEALCAVIARRPAIAGYFAGHTHRNRVRRFAAAREVPIVEVACVKDYPGAWARYDVYEGGYVQTVRRASRPGAMAWAEKTRQMFGGLYRDYALGSVEDRSFTQPF